MPSSGRSKHIALLGLAVLTLIWSYNWIVMKSALRYMGAFEFSALRSVFGAMLLLLVLRLRGQTMRPTPLVPTLVVGLLQIGGMVGLSQWALVSGGAGKVAVLVYTMPFWVILMAACVLGERMRGLQYVAVAVAAVGITLVLQPWNLAGAWQSSALAVLAGFCWAASAVAAKRVYAKYPDADLLSLTAWQMVVGSVAMVIVALCVVEKPPVWNGYIVFALAYNGVLATALAWALWLYILKNLPAGVAGLGTLAIPAGSVFFAWVQLGEVPSLAEDAGVALVILALAMINIRIREA